VIGLVGVPADSFTFANGVLALFAAGGVSDTLKLNPGTGGFAVFSSPGGVVISSGALGALPPSLHALPLHQGT
jgi:hypothetical protein